MDASNLHRNQLSGRESLVFMLIAKLHVLQKARCREQFHFKVANTYKLVNNLTGLERDTITVHAKSLPSKRFIFMEYVISKCEAMSLEILRAMQTQKAGLP
jgi:hypothetical protein